MQFHVLKTRYLYQKLVKTDKMPHDRHNLDLFHQFVFFQLFLGALQIETQLIFVLCFDNLFVDNLRRHIHVVRI